MSHRSVLFATCLLCLPLAAGAQELGPLDENADSALDPAEFAAGLEESGLFDRWDSDNDDLVGDQEFADGLYALWDTSGDGTLAVDEWDTVVDAWFGEADVNLDASEWDDDGDGTISREEFQEALQGTGLFERIAEGADPADAIDEDEFGSAFFDVADADDSEFVDRDETDALPDLGTAEDEDLVEIGEEDIAEIDPVEDEAATLIERGEAFTALPIPCGGTDANGANCQPVAERFCEVLGYGPPIDFLASEGDIYALRCEDEI